jgi:AbrB family looped-hinge helix DNA binding protein
MTNVSTTRLSSKGQVVIPEEIRRRLGLQTGVEFVVVGEGDVVVLKAVQPPSMRQFDDMVRAARTAARAAGMTRKDVPKALRKVRRTR